MANEISTQVKLGVVNGDTNKTVANISTRITQDTTATLSLVHDTEQIVGTSEEALSVGDVATPGLVFLRNLDATNFVTWGTVTTDLGFQLNPGEWSVVRLKSGESILLQADTAACKVQVAVIAN